MMMFLVLKEQLKSFYGKFGSLCNGVIRFVYTLVAVLILNQNVGFMSALKNPVVPVALALAGAFLPYGAISFLLAFVLLAHLYAVSFEIALLTAVFLVIVMFLYYGFQPGDSFWLVLTPIAFILKIPVVIPLLAGLAGSLVTVIPVGCGIVIYYIMMYAKQNAGVLTNDASVDITQKFVLLIKALVGNQAMMIMLAVAAAGILVVYLIHILSVDYAWILAIVMGTVVQLAVVFAGDYLFDVSVPIAELVAGAFLSMLLAGIYHFFVFAVDYSRTEYTQFEDDEYVYYVKAVPKVAVSRPDVRVQRINNPAGGKRAAR